MLVYFFGSFWFNFLVRLVVSHPGFLVQLLFCQNVNCLQGRKTACFRESLFYFSKNLFLQLLGFDLNLRIAILFFKKSFFTLLTNRILWGRLSRD